MKGLIASITVLSLVGAVAAIGVGAADTASVAATVTAQLVSVSVSDGTVDYGILATSTSKDTVGVQTQTATNNSNVTAKLDIKSSDAVGGTPCNLAGVAAPDVFT